MRQARALPVFSAAFAVIYLICMYYNFALVSYFPRLRQWHAGTVTNLGSAAGPGMYWYGWIATAAIAAAIIAALSLLVPARASERTAAASAWMAPTLVMLFLLFILRGWFVR